MSDASARRAPLALLLGLVLIAGALWMSAIYIDVGDSTCGNVLFNRSSRPACRDTLAWPTVIAGALAVGGLGLTLYAWTARRRDAGRAVPWLAGGLVLAGIGLLVAAARPLGSSDDDGCGSYFNRPAIEGEQNIAANAALQRRCAPAHARQLRAALWPGAAAVVAIGSGVVVARRQRR